MDKAAERRAFLHGYWSGAIRGEATAAEADALMRKRGFACTAGETEAFCQGSIDGAVGDTYRLRLTLADRREALIENRSALLLAREGRGA